MAASDPSCREFSENTWLDSYVLFVVECWSCAYRPRGCDDLLSSAEKCTLVYMRSYSLLLLCEATPSQKIEYKTSNTKHRIDNRPLRHSKPEIISVRPTRVEKGVSFNGQKLKDRSEYVGVSLEGCTSRSRATRCCCCSSCEVWHFTYRHFLPCCRRYHHQSCPSCRSFGVWMGVWGWTHTWVLACWRCTMHTYPICGVRRQNRGDS